MERVEIDLGERSYRIEITNGLLSELGRKLNSLIPGKSIALVTDENVGPLYEDKVRNALREEADLDYTSIKVPAGEASKSLNRAGELYGKLIDQRIGRDGSIIALGGGVVGDLAGFVAATYLRGIPYIQVPTTVLSQVDSSVGGKTAINHGGRKNSVGAFYQPLYVAIDTRCLKTLPQREFLSGLGEILKYGLIRDLSLLELVLQNLSKLRNMEDLDLMEEIIARCCKIKSEIVQEDEQDRGLRQILNFGHSIGHGLESYGNLKDLTHGEAVIWGMLAETWIAVDRNYLPRKTLDNLVGKFLKLNLPQLPTPLEPEKITAFMRNDKKNRGGSLRCVLLQEPGSNLSVEKIEGKEVEGAVRFLEQLNEEVFDSDLSS